MTATRGLAFPGSGDEGAGLEVVRGTPDPEELAALVVAVQVLARRRAGSDEPVSDVPAGWAVRPLTHAYQPEHRPAGAWTNSPRWWPARG